MSFNGSGTFVRLYNWVNDKTAGIKVRADRMDAEMDGFATGLSTCLTKDGQTTVTANLPMANFKHTGVGNATARTDYAAAGQVQDGKLNWVAAGGTADAITATYSPAITALVDGQICYVRAGAANATTTPTFSPNGLTARTITKNGNQALVAGDIFGASHELILRYRLSDTKWELLNPSRPFTAALTSTDITGQTAAQSDVADYFVYSDTSASGALKKDTIQGLYTAADGLTEDTSPAGASDFVVTYDTSATAAKKVKPTNLLKAINDLSTVTPDTSADYLPFYDTSGSVAGKCLLNALVSNPYSAQNLAATGYITLVGGLKFNWGVSTSIGAASSQSQTFNSAFSSAVYGVFIGRNTSTSGAQAGDYVSSVTTSGFTINNQSGGAGTFYWFAVGQ